MRSTIFYGLELESKQAYCTMIATTNAPAATKHPGSRDEKGVRVVQRTCINTPRPVIPKKFSQRLQALTSNTSMMWVELIKQVLAANIAVVQNAEACK